MPARKKVVRPIEAQPLHAAAMLVCLSNSKWGNRKSEEEIADDTAESQEAEKGTFKVTKRLVSKEHTAKATTALSQVKTYYYKRTLPWGDDKYRILPSAIYEEFIAELRRLQELARAEVDNFLKVYAALLTVEQAKERKRLGKAYRDSDYPTVNEMRRKWATEVHFMAMPSKADFRADIPAKEVERVRQDIDKHVQEALEAAQRDLFQRLYKVVVAMRDKLADYRVEEIKGGKKKVHGAFRDSAVSNVKELCDLLPKLNFTQNPDLDKLAREVSESLGTRDPEELRDDDKARSDAIEDADALLARMKEVMGE